MFCFFSPASTLCNLLSYEQLCWDNSYYCLLVFMIGFHIQYDFLTTVPRTWKGHLPHLISVTVKEHPSLWQQKKDRGKKRGDFFSPPQPGWHPRWPAMTRWSAQKDGKIGAKGAKKFVLSLICLCYIIFKSLNIYTLIFRFILKSVSLCSLFTFPVLYFDCLSLPCCHRLCLAKLPYKTMFLPALACWQVTVHGFVSVFL